MPEEAASTEAVEVTTEQAEVVAEDVTTESAEQPVVEETTEAAEEPAVVEQESEEDDSESEPLFESVEDAVAAYKKLRSENASRRVKNKELEEQLTSLSSHFEGADDDFKEGWLALGKELLTNPDSPAVRDIFAELAKAGISEEQALDAIEEAAEGSEISEESDFNASDVEAKISSIFAQKEAEIQQKQQELAHKAQEVAVQEELAKVAAEVRELGFNPDATADDSPVEFAEHRLFWNFVGAQPEGSRDFAKAKKAVEAYKDALLTSALDELKKTNTGVRSISGGGVSTAKDQASKPESIEEKVARILNAAK